MKKICLCFQIHQPYRLRRYRFFDIGNSHYYTDDYLNEEVFERIADACYIPANRMLLELLKAYPDFRVSFSISGLALEQMEYYKPALIDSFKELAATGRVEFVAETYAHSVASLYDPVEFRNQVRMQQTKLRELFGIERSRVFCNIRAHLLPTRSPARWQQWATKGLSPKVPSTSSAGRARTISTMQSPSLAPSSCYAMLLFRSW